ncbi:MAG: hypothetical protein Q7K42_05435 [Candidatus Diapherotrites archaeon]|nr:hypothetical protein [Candidatus Diapherotrites archaeon]
MVFFQFATIDSVFILQVATLVVVIIVLWRLSHLEELRSRGKKN